MSDVPEITIAIPFHSNIGYLKTAVESVKAQTANNWVCIVIDDSVTPSDAADLVESFRDSRIRHLNAEKNQGIGANWNRCIDNSLSDLVMILHGDDELKPDAIAKMLSFSKSRPEAAGYFCDAEIIDSKSKAIMSFPDIIKIFLRPKRGRVLEVSGDGGLASIMRGNYIICPTMIYRTSKLNGLKFSSDFKMVLDLEMFANILLSGGHLLGSPDVLYRYRRHAENQTSQLTKNLRRFEEEILVYQKIAAQSAEYGWTKASRICAQKNIVRLHMALKALQNIMQLDFRRAGTLIKLLFK